MKPAAKISLSIVLLLVGVVALWYFYLKPKMIEERVKRMDAILTNPYLVHYTQKELPPKVDDPAFGDWAFLWVSLVNDTIPGLNAGINEAVMISNFVNSPNGLSFRSDFFQEPCYRYLSKNRMPEWRTKSGKYCGGGGEFDFSFDTEDLAKMMFG